MQLSNVQDRNVFPILTLSIWIILFSCPSRTQRLIVVVNNQLLSGTNNGLKLSHEWRSFTGQGNKIRFQPRLTFDCQKLATSFRAVPIGKPCSHSTQGYSVSNTNHTCGNKSMDIGTQNEWGSFLFPVWFKDWLVSTSIRKGQLTRAWEYSSTYIPYIPMYSCICMMNSISKFQQNMRGKFNAITGKR
jgi:hypothetical protein